jgi:hypothetical protein
MIISEKEIVMESIYNDLNRFIKGSNRFGTNEGIARYLLVYLDEIPNMKLSEVAAACNVSTPSVIRFCRELGYDDFTDFKQRTIQYFEEIQAEIKDKKNKTRMVLAVNGSDEEFEESLDRMCRKIIYEAKKAILSVDREQMRRLASQIAGYRYIYVFGMGLSGIVAENFRIRLARYGKTIITLGEPQYDIALTPDKTDTLAIIVTQKGNLINRNPKIVPYLLENADKIWVISQTPQQFEKIKKENIITLHQSVVYPEAAYHEMEFMEEMLGEFCKNFLLENGENS